VDADARSGAGTQAYLRAREREGRLLPDALVASLPDLPASHPLADEWAQRADSARRLVGHVRTIGQAATIVDLGCGNGWLAHRLAALPATTVLGIDANVVELDQARRVFVDAPNLTFAEGDITAGVPPVAHADVVVLSSVIQYVTDLAGLVAAIRAGVAPGSEIHILDSPLYRPSDVAAAIERTRRYYAGIGVPEMADHYHHHTWDELSAVPVDVLYSPAAWRPRVERRVLRRARSPFPWLRIRTAW
jgi:SAM-dependent methyltransferase